MDATPRRAGAFDVTAAIGRSRALAIAATAVPLVLAWLAAILLVDPRAEVPLIDDWTYALSVEDLLAGRGLVVSSWSSTFPAVQIWWGALVAALDGGFSLTALRASTLVLALAGTCGLAGLLRELGCDRRRALLGALVWLVYPVAFVLSFTFMTDVPFVVVAILSLWAIVRGLRTVRLWPIALGLALAVVAFLIRPVAIAIPAALTMTIVIDRALPAPGERARGGRYRRVILALALATLLTMTVASLIAMHIWPSAGEGGLAYRAVRIRYLLSVSPIVYAEAGLSLLAHVGLAASPALLATAPSLRRWPWRTALTVLLAALAVSIVAPSAVAALKPRATWSTQEIGAARPLLLGWSAPTRLRAVIGLVATVAGLIAGACVLKRIAAALRKGALRNPAWTCLASFGACSTGLIFALWFFYDRYYLPLVPVVLAFILAPTESDPSDRAGRAADGIAAPGSAFSTGDQRLLAPRKLRTAAVVLSLVGLALLDVTGTRDMLSFARTVSGAVDRLHAKGVPYHRIDAGYPENGWRLYAHPQNLPPGATLADVPHVTSAAPASFAVAESPQAGYQLLESESVPTWWAQGDRLYVLSEE